MSDRRTTSLIVALDVNSEEAAVALASRLDPALCRVKVGMELYTAAGPAVISALHRRGFQVFLDLKYHDIPHTVARACAQAVDLGVWMLNVHALGGARMLAAARAVVPASVWLIGVTVLTSHSPEEVKELGLGDAGSRVHALAASCVAAGLDGVVCSGQEAASLRVEAPDRFLLVTPGIRPSGTKSDDQRRVMSISEAVQAGSDYLVIGRPITEAADPYTALLACWHETQRA